MNKGIIKMYSLMLVLGVISAIKLSEKSMEYPYNDDAVDTDDITLSM